MYLLSWPKTRRLTPLDGDEWVLTIEPGRLTMTREADGERVTFADVGQLRSAAMQLHAAAVDLDLEVQAAAVKASVDRRAARARRGEPTGLRHGPFAEPAEPPMHMEVPA